MHMRCFIHILLMSTARIGEQKIQHQMESQAHIIKVFAQSVPEMVIKFLGENPGACPWDEAKKYFSKSLMSISSEYTLQI